MFHCLIYALVLQDLVDGTVDAGGMKTIDSKETVGAFSTIITKRIGQRTWVDRRAEFAGELEKLCESEGIQFYSTMSETEAASSERTKGIWTGFVQKLVTNQLFMWEYFVSEADYALPSP